MGKEPMSDNKGTEVVLQTKDLVKTFPGVVANDRVNLEIKRGEIHCLLGENGAGKSTLAECLYGAYRPESGQIFLRGEHVVLSSPRDAIQLGIGMVHQHFELIPPMTVIENIVVGTHCKGIAVKFSKATAKVEGICRQYGVEMDLGARVADLPVGTQQWVEIIKALFVDISFLILDEPTAVLTPQETERLFGLLRQMTKNGLSIVLITHKLNEVMQISDRVSVMRKGKLIETVDTAETNEKELAKLMVGRDVVFRIQKNRIEPGQPVLQLENVCVRSESTGKWLTDVNLTVRSKEIVGIAGVAGNGQRELFDVLVGVQKVASGHIYLNGHEVTNISTKRRMQQGIASIPEDRLREGLLMESSIADNLILGYHWEDKYTAGMFMDAGRICSYANEAIKNYDIKASSHKHKVRLLSGGNLQKVILAREISQKPVFLLASQPTRGLDVGAIEYVQRCLIELKEAGAGIILISEELEEIFALSDYIAVLYRGSVLDVVDVKEATIERIGLLMGGVSVVS